MIAFKIFFRNGRFHATPWDKHVNECVPEWPPSIWRLSRAIISVWKKYTDIPNDEIIPIIYKLHQSIPTYYLPIAIKYNTCHYFHIIGKEPKKIFDAFVSIGNNPVYIIYDTINLNEKELTTMNKILENMNYFGRSESLCDISIIDDEIPEPNCVLFDGNTTQLDVVSVLQPSINSKFIDLDQVKITDKKQIENITRNSFTVTVDMLKNYTMPPSSKYVDYVRPKECFTPKRQINNKLKNISCVKYAITGMKPQIKDVIKIGDLSRIACMSIYGKKHNHGVSKMFTGKDSNGIPLKGHNHAFFIPIHELQNQKLDHLVIFTTGQFNDDELNVLFELKRLYKYNVCDIELVYEDSGMLDDFSNMNMFRKNNVWYSVTPYIPTRHTKYKGKGKHKRLVDTPKDQIKWQLEKDYSITSNVKSIKLFESNYIPNTNLRPIDFHKYRSHGSIGYNDVYTVRLEFNEPVQGPITLGYGSHYGMGLFLPEVK